MCVYNCSPLPLLLNPHPGAPSFHFLLPTKDCALPMRNDCKPPDDLASSPFMCCSTLVNNSWAWRRFNTLDDSTRVIALANEARSRPMTPSYNVSVARSISKFPSICSTYRTDGEEDGFVDGVDEENCLWIVIAQWFGGFHIFNLIWALHHFSHRYFNWV